MDRKELAQELGALVTEGRNPESEKLDQLDGPAIARLMNKADAAVPAAIANITDQIGEAIEAAANALRAGGRIIYMGAGTSGRLGVLDAAECPPTFGVEPGLVVGLIAGGERAMFKAQEGAEDSAAAGESDLKAIDLGESDFLVGIAASGRTPYVIGGLEYAKSVGAKTAALTCNPDAPIAGIADIALVPVVGPEVLSGSTRLKAGTAQKLVLNMISTGAMVRTGRCYGNLMVDVQATNEKLEARAVKIVMEATDVTFEQAEQCLGDASGSVKLAIACILTGKPAEEAAKLLADHDGFLSKL